MSNLLFYKNVVALNTDQHRNLKMCSVGSFSFACEATAIPIVAGEFADIARQSPIGFLRADDGAIMAVTLVGLPGGKNLYVDDSGRWSAPYVPAFVRRYPFVFAESGVDQLTLCVDEDYDGFGKNDGQLLFESDGQPGGIVKDALALLTEFQRQHEMTRRFAKRLEESGLLMEATASASLPDGSNFTLQGLLVVDESKLRNIPEALMKECFGSGELGLIYAHLLSLGTLLELLRRQPAIADAPAMKQKAKRRRIQGGE